MKAHNENGWSTYSQLNVAGTLVQSVPLKMTNPTEGSATTLNQVQINWTAMSTLLQTGGTMSTLSYHLEMYNTGTSAWNELVGKTAPFTGLTYTKTGLTVGTDYRFRI